MQQTELVEIFQRLKKILKKYEKPLVSKIDLDSRYDLWSIKDIELAGRKRNEVSFAGLIIQSSYVGFYFMSVYTNPETKKFFKPELLKCLKGKSCFHITKLDSELEKQIADALQRGFTLYKKRGWI